MLEKSWNLNLANFEILHLLTILKQALVCMSPVLGNSIWIHFSCFVSHCSLNFECPSLGYGFLSIIVVLEKCNSGPWKSLKSVWILYFEFAVNPGCSNSSSGTSFNWLHDSIRRDEFKTMLINYFCEENELENSHKPSWNCAIPSWAVLQIDNRVLATKLHVLDCSIVHFCRLLTECCSLSA